MYARSQDPPRRFRWVARAEMVQQQSNARLATRVSGRHLASSGSRSVSSVRLIALLLAVVTVGAVATASEATEAGPVDESHRVKSASDGMQLSYDPSSSTPLIRLYRIEELIQHVEQFRPVLEVYGDGRVVTFRPSYKPDPGRATTEWSRGRIDELLKSLHGDGLLNLDLDRMEGQQRERRRQRALAGSFSQISDASISHVHLSLESYRPQTDLPTIGNYQRYFKLVNIDHLASRYPDIAELRKAQRGLNRLRDVMRQARDEARHGAQ